MAKTNKELWEEVEKLSKRVANLEQKLAEKPSWQNDELEMIVSNCMKELRVPKHISGYEELCTAIILVIEDASLMHGITTLLYPAVAKQYNTTDSCTERRIRYAIEQSWTRANVETEEKIFGFSNQNSKKPSTSEFIAMVVDYIRKR